jgi:predicted transcriptional regulator
MQELNATLTLRVPADLRDRLERLAGATDRTRAWLALDALEKYVDLNEWQIAEIEAGIQEADAGTFATADEVADVFARFRR